MPWCAFVVLSTSALLAHAGEDSSDGAPVPPQDAPGSEAVAHAEPRGAEAPARARRSQAWDVRGEARLRAIGWSDPPLDDLGTTSERPWWMTSRVLIGADWRPSDDLLVDVELEALQGALAGPRTEVGRVQGEDTFRISRSDHRDPLTVLPRKLYVQWTAPRVGRLTVGAQMFSWGTGILANDGAGDEPFGDPNQGSVVARASFATRPASGAASPQASALAIFAAFDVVLRDDNAFLYRGDTAIQGLIGLRTDTPRLTLGAFGVARFQRDRPDPRDPRAQRTTVTAFPMDAHVRVQLTRPDAANRVDLEAEVVHIRGRTDRSYSERTQGDSRINSLGAVLRARWDHQPSHLTATLEAGYASGDADGRDDVVRTFSFHTDHNVGILLFEHLLPLISARGVDRALDPSLSALAPPGSRYLVNQGAVSNAWYLFPVLRARPVTGLDLRLGWLVSWADAPLSDAYQTAVAGGYPVGPGGVREAGRFYGHEIDGRIGYTLRLPSEVSLELGVEGAAFLAGSAFDGLGGARLPAQGLGRGRVTLSW